MSSDPKISRLQAIPLFRKGSEKALGHLAQAADETTVDAGRTLIDQGHHHNEAYVIISGVADVVVDGEVIAEIPAGEMVGELGYFARSAASATVKAKTDLEVLVIPYNRFDQVLDDNPDLLKAITIDLAERLVATDERLR